MRTAHRKHLRIVAIATALVLGVAACGDDDASPAASAAATDGDTVATTDAGPDTSMAAPATDDVETMLSLPTKRSDVTPTAGDLPNGVYRVTETLAELQASDPAGSYSAADELIMEFVLKDGTVEVHYFNMDSTPMAGEPPDTGGAYEVHGDQMVFATPPERSMPGTNGIYVLQWSMDGDTLTLEQIDGRKLDADFMAPWVRVGDAP